jgi:hypothetical protein
MSHRLETVARRMAVAVVVFAGAWVVRRVARSRRRPVAPLRALSRRRGAATPSLVAINPADSPMGEPGRNQELRLDEALQETFPASDPISTGIE